MLHLICFIKQTLHFKCAKICLEHDIKILSITGSLYEQIKTGSVNR